jgi:DNA-binding IscR family transcriptional regulator
MLTAKGKYDLKALAHLAALGAGGDNAGDRQRRSQRHSEEVSDAMSDVLDRVTLADMVAMGGRRPTDEAARARRGKARPQR